MGTDARDLLSRIRMSPLQFHGAEYHVCKIFSNKFVFEVARHQRPYAWTTEGADELFDDLVEFMRAATVTKL